jgi:4-hydroxybenzoyl-CoA thioesterase/acyl-CoA thioester hydrolase
LSSAPLFEHRLKRRVQFHETDAAGVVHFSRYFLYMEEAEHALWRAAGLSIHPRGTEQGWPRVQASFEYHRALRFEDEFDVAIRIVAMDERTIAYACLLSRDGARIATGRCTIACASLRPGEPMRGAPIPDEVRARLAVAPDDATLPPEPAPSPPRPR